MSDNHTKLNVRARHGVNSSLNDTNSSLKAQNSSLSDMNSSFNSSIINMCAKLDKVTKYQLDPRCKKNDVTGAVTHFFVKQAVATDDNNGYYKDLSKITSDSPSRALLAFFVPNTCLASQAKHVNSTAFIYLPAYCKYGGKTVYDGLTLQNKRALGRICKAASSDAESKTRHLLDLSKHDIQSVTLTQKSLGDSYHG
ncbi:hypothetical protein [Psychrobacter sp. DAB_AL32B]|uniref:hypothetical protein n=1 Tax=Psychrobacter sp. DAB_AL32B TaxID=1028414 RepID=UPI000B7FFA78|nr:hypothetical protein [Psychrobacter sp. DAB_AL32B]OXL24609.1 hypothetical protein CAN34_05505 [Psychrobacter sp. DAB_AL32B]